MARSRTKLEVNGRYRFLAPELSAGIMQMRRSSEASDIFSLAMIFLYVWSGHPPLHEIDPEQVARELRNGLRPKPPSTLGGFSARVEQLLWALLVTMWAADPSNRPSSQNVWAYLQKIFRSVEQDQISVISNEEETTSFEFIPSPPSPPPSPPPVLAKKTVRRPNVLPESRRVTDNFLGALFKRLRRWVSDS